MAGAGSQWPIIITEWALNAYLNMKHQAVFTDAEYRRTIRPDVKLLREGIPSPHPKFGNSKFWGPAKIGKNVLQDGFKMKWHNIGPGQVQLRLPVMVGKGCTYLCEAYVKADSSHERRMLARFKSHMNKISQGHFTHRGIL